MTRQGNCECGSAGAKKKVLVYACSGAANVAEIADHAARRIDAEGLGRMFCLAGLGAENANMIQTARDADLNLAIDGCPMDCARQTFRRLGLTNVRTIRVTDHGIDKAKGVKITEGEVQKIVFLANEALVSA